MTVCPGSTFHSNFGWRYVAKILDSLDMQSREVRDLLQFYPEVLYDTRNFAVKWEYGIDFMAMV